MNIHSDDIAVDEFSQRMKEKLAKKRSDGRSGWDDKEICSQSDLNRMLWYHIGKGDPVDVANLAMMLSMRGERTEMAEHAAMLYDFAEYLKQYLQGDRAVIDHVLAVYMQEKKMLYDFAEYLKQYLQGDCAVINHALAAYMQEKR